MATFCGFPFGLFWAPPAPPGSEFTVEGRGTVVVLAKEEDVLAEVAAPRPKLRKLRSERPNAGESFGAGGCWGGSFW